MCQARAQLSARKALLPRDSLPSVEPTLGVTVGFLSGEVCEQRSHAPDKWDRASATSEWRNLQVQGLTGLGLVVPLPGNIQAANSSAVACLY